MARYLLSLGHTSAVYLSALHYTTWSQSRLKGVAGQFSRAGYPDGVQLAANSTLLFLPAMLTASGLRDADVRSLMALKHTPSQTDSLDKEWMDFKARHQLPYPGYPQLSGSEKEYLVELVALNRRKATPQFRRATHEGALDVVADRIHNLSLRPLYEQAAAHTNATAWICANDSVAFGALSFLQKRKVKVPHEISVTGFDNVPVEALGHRLTTFDFNALEFIHRMLNFIVRPPRVRGPHKHQTIEVEGIIVERDTTGRAIPSRQKTRE
jgi:DNA-binding LacI/PurR family transcriptional regulator